MTSSPTRKFSFISSGEASLYMSETLSSSNTLGTVIFIPALLEEMNASRHLSSLAALELASHGLHCIQFDLFGTGDSSGDLQDATLELWQQNITDISAYAQTQSVAPIHFIALRAGALLAPSSLPNNSQIWAWHPILKGRHWAKPIQRTAALLSQQDAEKQCLEYAGYAIPKALLESMSKLDKTADVDAQHTFYIDDLAPQNSDTLGSIQVHTSPFWVHQELEDRDYTAWIEQTITHLTSYQ
ncbi:hypothetical protein [Echinimonas agarilytica]|uniref:Serine aminopeptidase S33 domain-containing protein n=1 Tax=Echinimonas agarilytica TaxID=1215918 RepID=A0AA42BB13_9GAMM|nr:hypothetical protein [Echinimonas agarilytica]MCM2681506.1 hypothetical protein [Echinimonas agarilytica]